MGVLTKKSKTLLGSAQESRIGQASRATFNHFPYKKSVLAIALADILFTGVVSANAMHENHQTDPVVAQSTGKVALHKHHPKDKPPHKHKHHHHKKPVIETPAPEPKATPTPQPTSTPQPNIIKSRVIARDDHNLFRLIHKILGPKGAKGIDISWPQCKEVSYKDNNGKDQVKWKPVPLPRKKDFVIVGVNDGHLGSANNCLTDMLEYAHDVSGKTKITPYYNLSNPGPHSDMPASELWPNNNRDPGKNFIPNPYGKCEDRDTKACAFAFGWNRSWQNVNEFYLPAVTEAGLSPSELAIVDLEGSEYLWYTDKGKKRNLAVAEGMTTFLESQGFVVVEYTNVGIKNDIFGEVPADSILSQPRFNWIPAQACSVPPIEVGSVNIMDQHSLLHTYHDHLTGELATRELDLVKMCV